MSPTVTRYRICNTQAELAAIHVRRDSDDGSKTFTWEGVDGRPGLGGTPTSRLPLYGSEDVANWSGDLPVIIVEGEKARDALARRGFQALGTVTGAAGCPDAAVLGLVRGFSLILWPDADEPGRRHMRKLAERLRFVAREVRVFTWSGAPKGGDAADYLADGDDAAEHLREQLASARPAYPEATGGAPVGVVGLVDFAFDGLPENANSDDRVAALAKLADSASELSPLQRTALSQEAVARLRVTGITSRQADDLARAALKPTDTSPNRSLQGTALELEDPEPWPDPVDGVTLGEDVFAVLQRFVVLPLEAAWAVVLWIFFTYLIASVHVAPRLLLTSATKACGKTRLMSLLWALVRRALPGSSITPAAVFRVIEAHAPTLLLDEVDNLGLNDKPELLAVLNSGHTRGTASVLRTVGDDHEIQRFSTWCALAMAAIRAGSLPDTATSRAIRIPLIRKRRSDAVERLREGRLRAELETVRRKLLRWSTDYAQEIEAAEPDLPDELDGRPADNWSVLISIADALGGEWPARARRAALVLEEADSASSSAGEMLLADLRDLFDERSSDRLSSEEIANALSKLEGRPWAEWGRQRKPMSKNQLARVLSDFDIAPDSIRFPDAGTVKGYYREQFVEAWERYIPPSTPSDPSHRNIARMTRVEAESGAGTRTPEVPDRECNEPGIVAPRSGVPVEVPLLEGLAVMPPGPLKDFLDGIPQGGKS